MSGDVITVDWHKNLTVAELKKNIQQQTSTPSYCQDIMNNDKILDYDVKLDKNKEVNLVSTPVKQLWVPSNLFTVDDETVTLINKGDPLKNCIWMDRSMETGKHQMSFELIKPEDAYIGHNCGLIPDDKKQSDGSTNNQGWFLSSCAHRSNLYGKQNDQKGRWKGDNVDFNNNSTVVRMEADLDEGTLHFWVNNKKVEQSFCNVKGPVRWATCILDKNASIKVVPTEPTSKQSYFNNILRSMKLLNQ